MITTRLNIASITPSCSREVLARWATGGSVPLASTSHDTRIVGRVVSYEFIEPDLWAIAEVDDDVFEFYATAEPSPHAEVLATLDPEAPRGSCPAPLAGSQLRMVILTQWPRGVLGAAALHFSATRTG